MSKTYTKITNEIMEEIRNGNTELRNDIIMEHERFIWGQLHKYAYVLISKENISMEDKNDLYNRCIVKILESINAYNPDKGSITTFLGTILRNFIIKYNRFQSKRLKFKQDDQFSIDEEVSNSYGLDNTTMHEMIGDYISTLDFQNFELSHMIHGNTEVEFTERQKIILNLKYKYRLSQLELSKHLRISESQISREVRVIKEKLKTIMG